jgi:hypothetical protein
MLRWSLVCIATAALAVAGATAWAQPVAQSSYMKADLSGFKGTNTTLINTIGKVEKTTGGRVLEIRYTNKGGTPGFHAVVAKGKEVVFLQVAVEGGKTVEVSSADKPDWMLKWPATTQLAAAISAKVPLVDAIKAAEQNGAGGPAVAAGIARSADNPTANVKAYNVLVLQGGDLTRVAVDDRTGQVIQDPSALSSWP